jgi:hypothetical protein
MFCEICGFLDDNHEDYCILGCNTMQCSLKMQVRQAGPKCQYIPHYTAQHPRTQCSSGEL